MSDNITQAHGLPLGAQENQEVLEFLQAQSGRSPDSLRGTTIQKINFISGGPGFVGDLYFAHLRESPSSYYLLARGGGKHGSQELEVLPSEGMALLEQGETTEDPLISVTLNSALTEEDVEGLVAYFAAMKGGDQEEAKEELQAASILNLKYTTASGKEGNLVFTVFDGGPEFYYVFNRNHAGNFEAQRSNLPGMEYNPEDHEDPAPC